MLGKAERDMDGFAVVIWKAVGFRDMLGKAEREKPYAA